MLKFTYRKYYYDNETLHSHLEISGEAKSGYEVQKTIDSFSEELKGVHYDDTIITTDEVEVEEVKEEVKSEPKAKKAKAPKKEKVVEPVKEYTAEEVKTLLQTVVIKRGRECALTILSKFNVTKSAELVETQFNDVAKECNLALE